MYSCGAVIRAGPKDVGESQAVVACTMYVASGGENDCGAVRQIRSGIMKAEPDTVSCVALAACIVR